MNSSKTKDVIRQLLTGTEPIVFFAVYYLYVWLLIEPRLVYYTFGRMNPYYSFLVDRDFLFNALTAAGGPVVCLTGFLSQCFYFSWLGALILTVVAWLFWRLSVKFFTVTRTYCIPGICHLFAIGLLMEYTRYSHPLLSILYLLTSFGAFVVYIAAGIQKVFLSILLFVMEFIFLYYLAGNAVILFGLLVGLYELLIRGRKTAASGIFALTAAYYVWTLVFDISDLIYPDKASFHIMNLLPFLILMGIAIYQYFLRHRVKVVEPQTHPSYIWRILKKAIPSVLIFFAFCISYQKALKISLKTGYYSCNGQWEEALRCARNYPADRYDILCNHDINRALYYTGRFGDEMFSYPQTLNALLLSGISPQQIKPGFSRMGDTYLDLGYPGIAGRLASESLELSDRCPYAVKQLAMINLVKQHNGAAKVYLNALSKDMIYGRFARQLLRRLDTDPNLDGCEPVQYLRSIAVENDTVDSCRPDVFFLRLLQKNPGNKMAFEYLTAFYLLTGQIDKIADNFHRLNDFSYEKVPAHFEEALMIYALLSMKQHGKIADLSGFSPSPETIRRIEKFNEEAGILHKKYSGDKQAMKLALAKNYGDSYIYYFNFGIQRMENE